MTLAQPIAFQHPYPNERRRKSLSGPINALAEPSRSTPGRAASAADVASPSETAARPARPTPPTVWGGRSAWGGALVASSGSGSAAPQLGWPTTPPLTSSPGPAYASCSTLAVPQSNEATATIPPPVIGRSHRHAADAFTKPDSSHLAPTPVAARLLKGALTSALGARRAAEAEAEAARRDGDTVSAALSESAVEVAQLRAELARSRAEAAEARTAAERERARAQAEIEVERGRAAALKAALAQQAAEAEAAHLADLASLQLGGVGSLGPVALLNEEGADIDGDCAAVLLEDPRSSSPLHGAPCTDGGGSGAGGPSDRPRRRSRGGRRSRGAARAAAATAAHAGVYPPPMSSQLAGRPPVPSCRFWERGGVCRNGDQCRFAHAPRYPPLFHSGATGGVPPPTTPAPPQAPPETPVGPRRDLVVAFTPTPSPAPRPIGCGPAHSPAPLPSLSPPPSSPLPPSFHRPASLTLPDASRRGSRGAARSPVSPQGSDGAEAATPSAATSVGSPVAAAPSPPRPLPRPTKWGVDQFDILAMVGQGAFGKVFRVRRRDDGRIFAMKVLRKSRVLRGDSGSAARALAERDALRRVAHPFVVSLAGAFQTPQRLYLVTEYVPGGHLGKALLAEGALDPDLTRLWAAELVLAVGHLHALGLAHRRVAGLVPRR